MTQCWENETLCMQVRYPAHRKQS